MKKFLLSAAMLIAAIGMSATQAYYVAGNGGADATGKWCNGVNWDPSNAANAFVSGQIIFTDVPAGTWEFKVTNGTWNNAFGYGAVDIEASSKPLSDAGGNIQFTLTSTQDITISFDGTTIVVLGDFGSGDFDPQKDYSIMVRVYSTPGVDYPMQFIGNGVYEAKSVNLDAAFKIADTGYSPVNYGGDGSFVDPSVAYTLLKGAMGNLTLEAAGVYDVTVTIQTDWSAELSLTPATAVENVNAAAISTGNGTIFAEGEMQIFDLTGKNVTAQNGQLKGNYIVVVGGQSTKVNVQ
ncbi:MAG: hypothetical protein EOL95_04635 [Bacteroidia bacterium]|nr:hypothetical protein [Bacteroidia bacterium]